MLVKDDFSAQVNRDYNSKPSNPKDIIGSGKIPFHLWPETASILGALALEWGLLKYGRGNFRAVGVRASIYYDAARRHLNAWFEGQDNDEESGLPHLAHALACIAVVVESQSEGKFTDDRNYPGGYHKLLEKMTPAVNRLKEIADKKGWSPKHYTIQDTPLLVPPSGALPDDDWTSTPRYQYAPQCEFETEGFGRCILHAHHDGYHANEIQVSGLEG